MRRRRRSHLVLCAILLLLFLFLRWAGFGWQVDTDKTVISMNSVQLEKPRFVIPKDQKPRLVLPANENPRLVLPANENPRLVIPEDQKPRLVIPEDQKPRLVLPGKERGRMIRPKQNGAALEHPKSFRLHYKFAFMLQTMGYSAPRPRSENEKTLLDQFFDTVQHFAITQRERKVFVELLWTFDRLCREHNFTYFLFFGSLLGAYRHHGMVPWDDDLDLMLPESEMGPLIVLLMEHAELKSVMQSFFVHRVFFREPNKSLPRYGQAWSWPYLELHFYRATGGYIQQGFNSCPKANEAQFFPLVRVPFEGHLVPAPRCMDRILSECYGAVDERCCTKNYDHRRGEDLHYSACVNCSLLREVFPFVDRGRLGPAAFEEKLILNGSLQAVSRVAKGRDC